MMLLYIDKVEYTIMKPHIRVSSQTVHLLSLFRPRGYTKACAVIRMLTNRQCRFTIRSFKSTLPVDGVVDYGLKYP